MKRIAHIMRGLIDEGRYINESQTQRKGVGIAFRRAANTQESIEVSLRAIDNEKNYTLTSYTDGTTKTLNGAELKKVLKIELKLPRSATLIEYAPAK